MRKLSAILLVSLFAFSQYARQISYLECKFANNFKPDSSKCDCEKLADFDNGDANQPPTPKTHTHIHLDEFYSTTKYVLIDSFFKNITSTSIPTYSAEECEGVSSKPWQPPNA